MGYSCTRDAQDTLGVIAKMFGRADKGSNTLVIGAEEYFYERGREQADGAITGELFLMLPGETCRRVGGFKIAPDGRIVRFPRLTKAHKEEAWALALDMRARNPMLLHSWSFGKI